MNTENWQPTASIEMLKLRAQMYKKIRAFFDEREVLEVETPLLSQATIPEPNILSIKSSLNGLGPEAKTFYLQTSPEFAMKRLLCAGSSSIFQITKAFRDEESGSKHNPEFSMLEWYRIGFDLEQLMDEMDAFLADILELKKPERMSYRDLFLKYCDLDPFEMPLETFKSYVKKLDLISLGTLEEADKDLLLDLIVSHCIEPKLGFERPIYIYDFPASQAALARISSNKFDVAKRFEVYINAMELANGFYELKDAKEQKQRFLNHLQKRVILGKEPVPIDKHFLAALNHGLPDCAGVAVGLDRLLMIATKAKSLAEVLSFTIDRA